MKKTTKILIGSLLGLAVAACSAPLSKTKTKTETAKDGSVITTTFAEKTDYQAQLDAVITLNSQGQKPVFELEAQDGQSITGLKAIRVYGDRKQVDLPAAPESAVVAAIHEVGATTRAVVPVVVAGGVAKAGLNAVRDAGTGGYQYVQAPAVPATSAAPNNITNNVTGDAVIGDASTLNSNSGTGAAGGNNQDTHSPVDNSNNSIHDNPTTATTNNAAAPAVPVVP